MWIWIEVSRSRATHLLHRARKQAVPIKSATTTRFIGHGGQCIKEDLIDRGHPGWTRVRKMLVSKKDDLSLYSFVATCDEVKP